MSNPPLNPVSGTLELLILRTLGAGSELHGFGILEWIKVATEGELIVEDGALYHALHRMERREWIGSEWGISEKGRRARYYHITKVGSGILKEEEGRWSRYVEAVAKISPCEARG
jgi:PadR family transcriptional regulator PadR